MRKLRGQKKYYKRLATANDLDKPSWLDFDDPNFWLDNWHLHFDWRGLGNCSFKKRKPHLDKLVRHFELLESETKKLKTKFQLYAVLLDYDSYSDALFLNTPNPNNEFPWIYTDLTKSSNLNNIELKNYINGLEGFEKYYGSAGENYCLLFKKSIGIELVE